MHRSPTPSSWIKIHKLRTFRWVTVFLNQQGKQYIIDNYFVPEKVAVEFREWQEAKGRPVYVANNKLRNFIRYEFKHRVYTYPIYKQWKQERGYTTQDVARICGYKNRISFLTSLFKWTELSRVLIDYNYQKQGREAFTS